MFIELTDHLRCPEPHPEQYLVLLPGTVERRQVVSGELGCPVCQRTFALKQGVFDLGGAQSMPAADASLEASALAALAGLAGPGGYLVLVGDPAARWRELSELLPGVGMVAVNPPSDVIDEPGVSVLRGPLLPLKARSMRGVVLGPGFGRDRHWVEEAVRVVLPGLRVAGAGEVPAQVELLAEAGGWWVGVAPRAGKPA